MRALVTLAAALTAALLTTACINEDTVDGPVAMTLTDVVTFEGNTSADAGAVFTFRKADDSPLITLTADAAVNNERVSPGTRLLVSYTPASGHAYTSGDVTLRGWQMINNGSVTTGDIQDYPEWNRDKVYLYSIWRDGTYINFHARMVYSTTPRTFRFMAAEATLDNTYPEIYLLHQLPEPTTSHDRHYYASFDIAPVWNRPTCRGVRIIVANSNLRQEVFIFDKKQ